MTGQIRAGADIGGTFTDIALECRGMIYSTKVLTNYAAPDQAILDGIDVVLAQAGVGYGDLEILIHGTTLATNALIERRGAKVAFLTTEGFRDVIEMRTESRFDQYDLNLRLPPPLVPREDRFVVRGRIGAQGQELATLDEAGLEAVADRIAAGGYGAVAIGFLHAYMNPAHEIRARAILAAKVGLPISISCEVSPQMREFERFNTVCANAYVRPQMTGYLDRLQTRLKDHGARCPVFMIHSGGGLISVETAAEFPVRLVESGPAGGAIFAADVARRFGLDKVVSYDMGGTTAKICLIEDFTPKTARSFEVARSTRFARGSGMPISIPVIEMIEIGAGGGSIAWVDAMGASRPARKAPASEPGPACYQRGGQRPAITDADLVLGKLDPENFAGGAIRLSLDAAQAAIARDVGDRLALTAEAAAFGICEVVDENMANAARVHAVENGKNIADNIMVAFGGAAPLHAARLCEKLGIDRCLIPPGAGVGSAIGFLKAPFGYEALASRIIGLSGFRSGGGECAARRAEGHCRGFCAAGHRSPDPVRDHGLHALSRAGLGNPGAAAGAPLHRRRCRPDPRGSWRPMPASSAAPSTACRGWRSRSSRFRSRLPDERPAPERHTLTLGRDAAPVPVLRAVFDPARGEALPTAIIARDTLRPGTASAARR
jgi:N-methylhydantoinase A